MKLVGVDILDDVATDFAESFAQDAMAESPFVIDFLQSAKLDSLNGAIKKSVKLLGDLFAQLTVEPESGFLQDGKTFIAKKSVKQDEPLAYIDTAIACKISSFLMRSKLARAEKASGLIPKVTVGVGDTLEVIAEKTLGSKKLYPEIAAINQLANPDRIRVGQVLELPSGILAFSQDAVEVSSGDSLWGIWKANFSQKDKFSSFKKRNSMSTSGGSIYPGTFVYVK